MKGREEKEVVVFYVGNRESIYEDVKGFTSEGNELENNTKERTNITALTVYQDDNEAKEMEQERFRRIVILNEDIENLLLKDVDYISDNYRVIKPKQFGVQDNHFASLVELQNFQGDSDSIWVAKFSSDGRYMATGGKTGVLKIWEVISFEDSIDTYEHNNFKEFLKLFNEIAFRIYTDHKGDIIDLAWSERNCNVLVTVSFDHSAILWDITRESAVQVYQHDSIVSCVGFYPNVPLNLCGVKGEEDAFITGCFDRTVRIWGKSNKEPLIIIYVTELITSVSFFPEASYIIMGSSEGKQSIYECVEKVRYSHSFNCRNKKGKYSNGRKVTEIYFINRKEAIITTNDSRIRLVNAFNGTIIHKFKGHVNEQSLIRTGYDDLYNKLVSASDNGYIYLWNSEMNRNTVKSKTYEYFRPFVNKKEMASCCLFATAKCLGEFNRKLHKINDMLHLMNVIVVTSLKGTIQVVLNYKSIQLTK